jgi:hypothetical protein
MAVTFCEKRNMGYSPCVLARSSDFICHSRDVLCIAHKIPSVGLVVWKLRTFCVALARN